MFYIEMQCISLMGLISNDAGYNLAHIFLCGHSNVTFWVQTTSDVIGAIAVVPVPGRLLLVQTPQICYTVYILNVMLTTMEFVLFEIRYKIEGFLTFKEKKNLGLKCIRRGVSCVWRFSPMEVTLYFVLVFFNLLKCQHNSKVNIDAH